jgi:hypothetical protein
MKRPAVASTVGAFQLAEQGDQGVGNHETAAEVTLTTATAERLRETAERLATMNLDDEGSLATTMQPSLGRRWRRA